MPDWIERITEDLFGGHVEKEDLSNFDQIRYRDEREQTEARIRGQNPPAWKVERIDSHNKNYSETQQLFWSSVVLLFLLFLLSVLSGSGALVVLLIFGAGPIAAVAYYGYFKGKMAQLHKEAVELKETIFLDAYNTEFTAPLADRSTVRITVQFHIPRKHNVVLNTSYGTLGVPHLVEQLNRVTEAKLLIFTQQLTEPPPRLLIEECLNRELVQFQNDNDVDVLRVQVPIAIHVHPDKPKGVNV